MRLGVPQRVGLAWVLVQLLVVVLIGARVVAPGEVRTVLLVAATAGVVVASAGVLVHAAWTVTITGSAWLAWLASGAPPTVVAGLALVTLVAISFTRQRLPRWSVAVLLVPLVVVGFVTRTTDWLMALALRSVWLLIVFAAVGAFIGSRVTRFIRSNDPGLRYQRLEGSAAPTSGRVEESGLPTTWRFAAGNVGSRSDFWTLPGGLALVREQQASVVFASLYANSALLTQVTIETHDDTPNTIAQFAAGWDLEHGLALHEGALELLANLGIAPNVLDDANLEHLARLSAVPVPADLLPANGPAIARFLRSLWPSDRRLITRHDRRLASWLRTVAGARGGDVTS